MARGVNLVILIGNCTADPVMTYSPSGLAVARVTLATNEKRKNESGEYVDKAEFHRITLFGKTAEACGQYVKKGSSLYLEGKISYGSYEKDGITRYTTDIICHTMNMLSGRDDKPVEKQQVRSKPPPPPSSPVPDDEDSMPF